MAPMWSADQIKQTLEQKIDSAQVAVDDLTGTSDHFRVTIVSPVFEALSPIEKHRKVYEALGTDVGGAIHALSIKAYSPAQWEKVKNSNTAS
ncbi:MAG: BolA family transcriptional regulator [Bdellovibrionales bacterium]|nr:BolA family transcriptional regulator [Bdellovibrionales bacterium]